MPNVITIGFKEFADKMKSLPNDILNRLDGECEDAAALWEELAVNAAPVDEGRLRGDITFKKVADMNYEVVSPVFYSPFIEWGTKTRVSVPADLQAYALQFKDKTQGDYFDFLNAILDWVKRKGIHEIGLQHRNVVLRSEGGKRETKKDALLRVAEAIAFSIIRHGIKPHPFFFPQKPIVEKEWRDNTNKILSERLR